MNLVLDFGNTRVKAGSFEQGELLGTEVFRSVQDLMHSGVLKETYSACMISSVTGEHKKAYNFLSSRCRTFLFGPETPIPIENRYVSKSTLGTDRLLAAIGAFTLYPDTHVLSIDLGTCIKYNFVNAENAFLGGAISPGIPMRLKAMHEFTDALPLPELPESYTQLMGDSTLSSLLSGAIVGAACEVDAMIDRYKKTYPGLKVVLTGGDSHYLPGLLKNTFFAHQNLLLIGLNSVLIYAGKA